MLMERALTQSVSQTRPRGDLGEIYRRNAFVISYELFPPKTESGMDALAGHVRKLLEFGPDFITCTYGAGGSTRDRTLETLALVQGLTDLPVATHLTCVGVTKDDLRAYLRRADAQGISHVVAIRGDAPRDQKDFKPVPGGLRYGNELVALIRAEFPQFGIAVGGYPETHPEAPSAEADLENLKRKVDAGADVVITQLFYNNDDFLRYRDRCAAIGVTVPIVPGILPVTSYDQIRRITSLCGATLPPAFAAKLEACGGDAEKQFEVGVAYATDQVHDLIEAGIPGVHFYVLNQSRAATRLLGALELPGR